MSDESQWHPEAALAALFFLSVLFAVAGLVDLMDIVEVELGFFEHSIGTRLGTILWITVSLSFAFLFGYLLRKRWMKKQQTT